jgi:hypothetical protein
MAVQVLRHTRTLGEYLTEPLLETSSVYTRMYPIYEGPLPGVCLCNGLLAWVMIPYRRHTG